MLLCILPVCSCAFDTSRVRWTKEGKNIEDNAKTRNKYGFQEGSNSFSLNIKNVSTQDAGEYECVVTIDSGGQQKEMKATRELQIFQKVMNINASQTNVTIVEGSTATLQCQLTYSEAINVSIFWLFEGKKIKARPLPKGDDKDIITIHATFLSLELTQATRKQSGIYTCGALSAGLRSAINISVNVTDAEGPELEIKGEAVQNFLKGNTTSLSCDAVFPEASFVDTFWTFNGSRIASNERRRKYEEYSLTRDDSNLTQHIQRRRLRLTIYDLRLNDTGMYTCNLNTSHGMAQENFNISVQTIDTTEDTKSAPFSGDSERDRGFTDTTVFISLGLFVAFLTTVMAIIVYLKLRSRRPILRRLPRFCLDNPQTTSRASVTFTSVAHE
ncbi:neural cell adhesion molecule 1-like isoform X2 [Acropora muricata]|uniref:neural cell adhesion molecule 1-like isoform X2 n=1 Tax=Acropora muricata TaxID=159855 RepID=UPI0034E40159